MLFTFSHLLIPKGLHWSLSITVPSVESHMQTNMLIHLVNFWTFFLMCVECIKRNLLSFPPTQLYGLESCELGLFLKARWAIFAHPVSFCFPREREDGWGEDNLLGYYYSVLSQCYSKCHTILVTSKTNALPRIVSWVEFISAYLFDSYVENLVLA